MDNNLTEFRAISMRNFFYVFFFLMLSTGVHANSTKFKVGETILVSFPANNIKDDAYIIGIIRKITTNGDYQITVRDYVQDHDYGLSCVPIAVNEKGDESKKDGWELWDNTKKLTNQGLEYVVPASKVVKLSTGQMRFIDRYNIYITYSRWKENAPVMSLGKLQSTKQDALSAGMPGIVPALDLAIKDRASYYDPENGRPYWSYESVPKLNDLLDYITGVLKKDPQLNKLWRNKKRDWKKIEGSMKNYFMVDALDKSVEDAYLMLWADEVEKSDPEALKRLKKQLKHLGKDVNF